MTNYKQLCAELVHIADALDGGKPLVANQGQALARWGNHPGSPDSSNQPSQSP